MSCHPYFNTNCDHFVNPIYYGLLFHGLHENGSSPFRPALKRVIYVGAPSPFCHLPPRKQESSGATSSPRHATRPRSDGQRRPTGLRTGGSERYHPVRGALGSSHLCSDRPALGSECHLAQSVPSARSARNRSELHRTTTRPDDQLTRPDRRVPHLNRNVIAPPGSNRLARRLGLCKTPRTLEPIPTKETSGGDRHHPGDRRSNA